jgi:4-amino-4-deoxy-L-arabinose transferase-like glycosyltransferase
MSDQRQVVGARARLRLIPGGRIGDGSVAAGPPGEQPPDGQEEEESGHFGPGDRTEGLAAPLLVLLGVTVIRLFLSAVPGLAADEAYYWTWSRALDSGYVDHPPAIAWLIRASTALAGGGGFGVRALCVLAGSLVALAVVVTARRPMLGLVTLCAVPLFFFGGLLATPDVPLLLGWSVAVAAAARGGRFWLLAGVAAGVAIMGKLTGVLLVPLLLLGCPPADRRSRWPWLGLLLTIFTVLPNLLWQSRHDWITWRFQFAHGLGTSGAHPGLGGLFSFLGAQLGLVTPLVFFGVALFWTVGWREKSVARLFWWTSLPVFLFFAAASVLAPAEANWAAPSYVGAALGLGFLALRWRRVVWVGLGMAGFASLLFAVHLIRPIVHWSGDPALRLVGGQELGQAVAAWGVSEVYAERYQEASWIRFYGGVPATVLPGTGRPNQFELWPLPSRHDTAALYVRPWRRGPPKGLELWTLREGPNTVAARDGASTVAGRWQVYELKGYRGPDSSPIVPSR